MANNLGSNTTTPLAKGFLKAVESTRVLTKAVNTQLLSNKFSPSSGNTVDFKRDHRYSSIETAGGDISSSTKSDIIAGKATGTVQNMITVATEWSILEQALELDELDKILKPMARQAITTLETNLATYMRNNAGLVHGTVGTVADAWSDIQQTGALMQSVGIPQDSNWNYVMNPFTAGGLADAQNGLTAADGLVRTAWERAQISRDFGGMVAMTSNALTSFTTGAGADRTGAINGTPTVTYVGAKDTMTQSIPVDAFDAALPIKAGDVIEIAGRYLVNQDTKELIYDEAGARIPFRATVTADVTMSSGAGTIVVTGAAIFEANGQYNTVDSALADNDVIVILGAASTAYQPNLFFHEQFVGLGTVKLDKLFSTDTVATTSDGFSLRVSKYSDGDANTQKVRFDILPAFAVLNPFFGGVGWGS
jgi:hypothetical protein